MVITSDNIPRSSFLSMEKDLNIIVSTMLQDERLKRLLFHTHPNCLRDRNLTEEESIGLLGKNIKIIPKLYIDEDVLNYVVVSFCDFFPNQTNPHFRDNTIEFDIICHIDQWQLKDMALRPYKIAGEIDMLFNNKYLTGIGKLEFMGAKRMVLTDEFAGVCIFFRAVHGDEDNKQEQTVEREELMRQDFKDLKDNGYSLSAYGRN